MKQLSALEISFLARELAFLEGAKLQQAYQPAFKGLLLQFHLKGGGSAIAKVSVPRAAYIASVKEAPERVSGFCKQLRKALKGAVLKGVSQPGFERILKLDFASKNGLFSLFFELFSKGDTILVQDGKIAAVEEKQRWSGRELAAGEQYKLPPEASDPRALDDKRLLQLLKRTKKTDLVRFLALELSLGGLYAEELCLLSGLEKKAKPVSLPSAAAARLLHSLKTLLSSKPSPSVIYSGGKVVDAVPVQLRYYKDYGSKPFKTFSEALDRYYSEASPVKSKYDREIDKLNVILEQQKEAILASEKEASEAARKGGLIYEHYQPIRQLIDELNAARKSGGWASVRELQRKYRKIKRVDEKTASVTIELQ